MRSFDPPGEMSDQGFWVSYLHWLVWGEITSNKPCLHKTPRWIVPTSICRSTCRYIHSLELYKMERKFDNWEGLYEVLFRMLGENKASQFRLSPRLQSFRGGTRPAVLISLFLCHLHYKSAILPPSQIICKGSSSITELLKEGLSLQEQRPWEVSGSGWTLPSCYLEQPAL